MDVPRADCAGYALDAAAGWAGGGVMERRIKVPQGLDLAMLRDEFGHQAIDFYLDRIKQRESEGRVYYNPLKTIYLWATADKATNQGYYTSYRGYSRGRKHKNYGGS